jgi:hypothetical protein
MTFARAHDLSATITPARLAAIIVAKTPAEAMAEAMAFAYHQGHVDGRAEGVVAGRASADHERASLAVVISRSRVL